MDQGFEFLCNRIATEKFKIKSLKSDQIEIIKNAIEGRDVLGLLPTGSGKSLCFQLFPFVFAALKKSQAPIVIVVQPLSVLIKTQAEGLKALGIEAEFFGSEQLDPTANSRGKEGKIIFCAFPFSLFSFSPSLPIILYFHSDYFCPETVMKEEWIRFFISRKNDIGLIVIDEVHSVTER